ncbi:MAG TPA: zinc ribbon domain-containing protein [candidate division Zixibacteria bacterium]|nr:zinc ribbon domain-containing protein [candidate division Zixibacteria bacterium]
MPIYEYQCDACGTFEVTQRITERALSKCPTCKGKVKRLISNTSFQLKGTGWYITDYARKGANGEKSDSKGRDKSTKDGSKTDSASGKSESSSSSASSS